MIDRPISTERLKRRVDDFFNGFDGAYLTKEQILNFIDDQPTIREIGSLLNVSATELKSMVSECKHDKTDHMTIALKAAALPRGWYMTYGVRKYKE